MRKFSTFLLLTILVLAVSQVAIGEGDDDRKSRILANLKVKYPQLEKASVVINEIKASAYGSLDEGSFTINGQQTQKFLISSDDKALYFITDPIDVSLDEEQLAAEVAKKAAEELAQANERSKELNALVADIWGNLGAILRAAAATGVDQVLLSPGTVDLYNPKVIRGGAGAHFYLPIFSLAWNEIEARLDGLDIWLAAARGDVPYTIVNWKRPTALIVGGEARGASARAKTLAGGHVSIPMERGIESAAETLI